MSQALTRSRYTRASLRGRQDAHTVLYRMALDEARATRVREQKEQHPDLTWAQIAEKVGVTERSAIDWQKTGGISYENCKKLAKVFGVDKDWLWSGAEQGTPDLMGVFSNDASQLDRIEAMLTALLDHHNIDMGVIAIERAAAGSIELLAGEPEAKPAKKQAPARKRQAS